MVPETKVCSKCGIEKDIGLYSARKDSADGKRKQCKTCHSLDVTTWHKAHRRNPRVLVSIDQRKKRQKEWRKENSERLHAKAKQWAEANKAKVLETQRRASESLSDRYVRNVIAGQDRGLYQSITKELIALKREQIQLARLTRKIKKEIANV